MVRYVIVSPVRDEEHYIELTLKSVIAQSVVPVEWVVVNDGSRDRTALILERYAAQYDWIKVVNRADRGCRKPSSGVIEAFYDGYAALGSRDWDYIVKLDGDLSFEPDYFEKCFEAFDSTPDLGICGGAIYNLENGVPVYEYVPLFHVRGATKIYRRRCWDLIGGLLRAPGWDTLDEIKANMLGWKTASLPELRLIHHRPTGAAQGSWKDSFKNGKANYITGYHPVFMLLKCVKRLAQRPYLIGSAGLLAGFVDGYLHRVPRVPDPELIGYVRKQQLRKLFGMSSLWDQV